MRCNGLKSYCSPPVVDIRPEHGPTLGVMPDLLFAQWFRVQANGDQLAFALGELMLCVPEGFESLQPRLLSINLRTAL
jgi:hypothetical protein